MASLGSLVELDDFQQYKQFIKQFILTDESLFRLIFFPMKNPFNEEMPENPYRILSTEKEDENDNHGVVLFKQKNNEILNYGTIIVLVDFETTRLGNSGLLDNLYIIFRIIAKSDDIQEIEDNEGNTINRIHAIVNLIDNNFNLAKINKIGEVRRQSYKPLSINEENCGFSIVYKCRNLSSHLLDNKNYLKKNYGVDSRENI